MKQLAMSFAAVFILISGVSAQDVQPPAQPPAQPECNPQPGAAPAPVPETDPAIEAAFNRVGWQKMRCNKKPLTMAPLQAVNRAGFGETGMIGAGIVANEFFSLIAEIAVDRAKREGLAIVKEKIEEGVCTTQFTVHGSTTPPFFKLINTCSLVRTTGLQELVGQGRALRTALTSDLLTYADTAVAVQLNGTPPLARSAAAALALVKRFAADPQANLTKNDVWLVADAFLNAEWNNVTNAHPRDLVTLQIALASARVYLQALQNSGNDASKIDLAAVIRRIQADVCRNGQPPENCAPFLETQYSKLLIEWTNLAVKAGSALKADGSEDFRTRLRSAVELIFEGADSILHGQPNADGIPAKFDRFSPWAKLITLAAIDGDAPRLIASLAETAAEALAGSCVGTCAQRRKVATLLTGVSTYALTYDQAPPPANADAAQVAAFLQQQREGRKKALEAVIDAATDRRGRAANWVTSLGTGVGVTLLGTQRLDLSAISAAGTESSSLAGQLHVPLGVAVQHLPGGSWGKNFPLHAMLTVLDLGNYVGKTNEPNSSPDWRSIFSPGGQIGVAIGKSNRFFVVGYSLTYAPRFVATTSTAGNSGRSALRQGLFVHYYVPLWDFN